MKALTRPLHVPMRYVRSLWTCANCGRKSILGWDGKKIFMLLEERETPKCIHSYWNRPGGEWRP